MSWRRQFAGWLSPLTRFIRDEFKGFMFNTSEEVRENIAEHTLWSRISDKMSEILPLRIDFPIYRKQQAFIERELIEFPISSQYQVPADRRIGIAATIIDPDGKTYFLTAGLRTGERWSEEREFKALASRLADQEDVERGTASGILRRSILATTYYVEKYGILPRS